MKYISVKQAAIKWGISERRVRALCTQGRIEGVTRCGTWVWSIPEDLKKPADGRTLRYIRNRNLSTGVQDYSRINSLMEIKKNFSMTVDERAAFISSVFQYDDQSISYEKIIDVLNLINTDIDPKTQLLILNINGVLEYGFQEEITEPSSGKINKRLLISFDEKNGGKYIDDENKYTEQAQALFNQYMGPWTALHPLSRSVFIFGELLRIRPYKRANTATAFLILLNSLMLAGIPFPHFESSRTDELKSALSSTSLRGNYQKLLSFIEYLIVRNQAK